MKMFRFAIAGLIAMALSTGLHVTASNSGSDDRDRDNRLAASLVGFEEVPSVSTPASGSFRARIVKNALGEAEAIEYTLTYSGLSSTVQQSHIHFAQRAVNGGIVLWLCQGVARAPAGAGDVPECPQEGSVSGELRPGEVVAIGGNNAGQQIAAGEFEEVLKAIRAGFAYVNVHSANSPGGEIRGQVRTGDNNGHRDH
jgi:hypothetical protein